MANITKNNKKSIIIIISFIMIIAICVGIVSITVMNQEKNFNGRIICDVDGKIKDEAYKEVIEKIMNGKEDYNNHLFSTYHSNKIRQDVVIDKNPKTNYRRVYDLNGNCILTVSGKGKMAKMKIEDMIHPIE